jgi:hypothetical protein
MLEPQPVVGDAISACSGSKLKQTSELAELDPHALGSSRPSSFIVGPLRVSKYGFFLAARQSTLLPIAHIGRGGP